MCSTWCHLFARLLGLFWGCVVFTSCSTFSLFESPKTQNQATTYEWSGIGFGIAMSAEVHGVTPVQGRRIGKAIEREIQRLERAFSLYTASSELSRLNRTKVLKKPSAEFVELLANAEELNQRTLGYYQPAIHGAWNNRHLRIENPREWQQLCRAASLDYLRFSNDSIQTTNHQTELSFNAIVQGHLADRVQAYLRSEGVESAMLHLGESYALGKHPEGRPWNLAVAGQSDLVGFVELENAGMAVSATDSSRELLNPRDWKVSRNERVVAIISEEGAAVADAFATAFAVAPKRHWKLLHTRLAKRGECQVKIWQGDTLVFHR